MSRWIRPRKSHRFGAAVLFSRSYVLDRALFILLHRSAIGRSARLPVPDRFGAAWRGSDDQVDRRPFSARDGSGHANGRAQRRRDDGGAFETIEAREPSIRASAFLSKDGAMEAAARADAARRSGLSLGPLHGLPVAVKDIIDTADMPTEFGARLHAGRRPPRTRPSSPACARPARSSWARSSPPHTRSSSRADEKPCTTYRDRREAPRWARRPPSPPTWRGRPRHSDQGLDHPAGVVLRRGGLSAQPWPIAPDRDPAAIDAARPAGSDGPRRRRCGLRGRRDFRPR